MSGLPNYKLGIFDEFLADFSDEIFPALSHEVYCQFRKLSNFFDNGENCDLIGYIKKNCIIYYEHIIYKHHVVKLHLFIW